MGRGHNWASFPQREWNNALLAVPESIENIGESGKIRTGARDLRSWMDPERVSGSDSRVRELAVLMLMKRCNCEYGFVRPELEMWLVQLALDPWARGPVWQDPPPSQGLQNFAVAVIGAGMGGLNAAVQLKHAGIPWVVKRG